MGENTKKLSYPYEIKETNPEETAEILKHFGESPQGGFVRVGPKGYLYPKGIAGILPKVYNMELRPDDTWVVTFPKAGFGANPHFIINIFFCFIFEIYDKLLGNDLDYAGAAATPLVARYPFLEMSMFLQTDETRALLPPIDSLNEERMRAVTNSYEYVAGLPSPRFIKSHLPFEQLPPSLLDTCRVVYVARDPRDVAVSYYHHIHFFKFMGYTSDWKSYWELFMKNLIDFTPYFEHVIEAWEKRNHPNMLFLFYEDMKKDLPSVVKRVAEFLGKTITEEQLSRLCDHLKFDNFKNNKSVNMDITKEFNLSYKEKTFVRAGKSGGWRTWFDAEMTAEAERWMADQLRNTDLRFPSGS